MDNLTHSLFALTLGRTALGQGGRGTTLALVIASNIPDIDIVAAAHSGAEYLHWHRGPTHGPLSLVGLGLPAAGLVWWWTRFRERRAGAAAGPVAPFLRLATVSMIGVALHLLMDFPTSYGTRLLSPFEWSWFALDWMPIIDIYLLAALGFGLMLGGGTPESRRRSAILVFGFMAANYAVRGVVHHQALALAPRVIGPIAARCADAENRPLFSPERWPQDRPPAATTDNGPCVVRMAAMPTFFSPALWRVITQFPNGYEIHQIDLLDTIFRAPSPDAPRLRMYLPNEWTPAVLKASETRLGQIYLGFSRFPAARATVDPSGAAVVRWSDMRFVGGVMRLDQPPTREPFSATIRLDANGRVVEERFGP